MNQSLNLSENHIKNTSSFAMCICLLSLILKAISAVIGKTPLQYIDAVRCLIETSVVVVWWLICTKKNMEISAKKKAVFDNAVRGAMIGSSIMMCIFAVIRYTRRIESTGSLYLGIMISAIGTVNNLIICLRYKKKASTEKSIRKQSQMFAVKSLADACVALTLTISIIMPGSPVTVYLQLITSLSVSVAMAVCGIMRS